MTATYYNSFNSHRVLDPKQEAYEQSVTNVWTDMEKCIFLDRFLQHPKDFRKIATYLRNKSTKDCIAFYYNSKQTVPYKKALKEHLMRRKRRGDYHVWDETIQAALSVGAVVKAGTGEDKPLLFMLPDDDLSYKTRHLHPLSLELLSSMELPPPPPVAESTSKKSKDGKSRKRNRDPLFILDPREQKFLRRSSQESASTVKRVNSQDDSKLGRSSSTSSLSSVKGETEKTPPPRKAQHRWSAGEKRLLLEAFEKHGELVKTERLVFVCAMADTLLQARIGSCCQPRLAPSQYLKSKVTTRSTRNCLQGMFQPPQKILERNRWKSKPRIQVLLFRPIRRRR